MPAAREIPGFYFDAEKNRYFPIKGPIPGSGRRRPVVPAVEAAQASSSSHSSSSRAHGKTKVGLDNVLRKGRGRTVNGLLHSRELHGRSLFMDDERCFFEKEFDKLSVSNSTVWDFQNTDGLSDGALRQFYIPIQTPEGQKEGNGLLMGSQGGYISLYVEGNLGCRTGHGFKTSKPHPVFPACMQTKSEWNAFPEVIWTPKRSRSLLSSSISSILKIGRSSRIASDDNPFHNALVTTLGSGGLGGLVYVVNLNEALDVSSDILAQPRISRISCCDFTIWTGACDPGGTKASLGTNQGAALLNLETGGLTWLYRTKSDMFSQQFNQSGTVVLCGLRNGSILAVDIRQKPSVFRSDFSSGRDPAAMHHRTHQKKWAMKRHQKDISSSCASMPSSVCSLVTLESDEQYFIGSSMNGSIELFDQRHLHRPVQSYDGHINSHSHLELGVDPSETFVLSGGEDCYLRIWSIKSSKLLFSGKFSDSILKTVCWSPNGDQSKVHGAWMGSREGLFLLTKKGII
ncbi:transducin/WD40 repeat-like superfamily protein [Wolffia australiana]